MVLILQGYKSTYQTRSLADQIQEGRQADEGDHPGRLALQWTPLGLLLRSATFTLKEFDVFETVVVGNHGGECDDWSCCTDGQPEGFVEAHGGSLASQAAQVYLRTWQQRSTG